MDKKKSLQDERRVHHELRETMSKACILLAPMVLSKDNSLKMSGFAMAHIVQNHFPTLSSAEAKIVVTVVERMHREHRLQTLLEK